MTTVSIRIDKALAFQAENEAKLQNRSMSKQLEFWARLGKAVSSTISMADSLALSQGLKQIKLELAAAAAQAPPITSDDVFAALEKDRERGILPDVVSSAQLRYEASPDNPGHLVQVDRKTGQRVTGIFENGEFKAA